MTHATRILVAAAFVAVAFGLSGCQDKATRAANHFASAQTLLAEGDEDRAIVELRNVFKYDGLHREARRTYADLMLKRGDTNEAYSHYLLLVEQYPDLVEVRVMLAELALARGDWREVERHSAAAATVDPDAPRVQALRLAVDYRNAVGIRDVTARTRIAAAARDLLDADPDLPVARRILIDDLMKGADPQRALPELDAALALQPDAFDLNMLKYRLLAQSGDPAKTGAQLQAMHALYPDNMQIQGLLVRWYVASGQLPEAERFLRRLAGPDDGPPERHMSVVQLLRETQGLDGAAAELQRLAAANPDSDLGTYYAALRAGLAFDEGDRAGAIATIESLLRDAGASDRTRNVRVMLARMLITEGNRVGGRARIEEVLQEDPTHVGALKLRAGLLIGEDDPGAAIVDLRTALGQEPNDPEILTLMAAAHERDGSPELAGERLALAVDLSGGAPAESLRYAQFLLRDGRRAAAEAVLVDAVRVSPQAVPVVAALAELRLANRDWTRVAEGVAQLRDIGTPPAIAAAQRLQAALLTGQDRVDESIGFLQGLVASGNADNSAVALILQTQLRSGRAAEARSYLDGILAERPGDFGLRLLGASLDALIGEPERAEATLRRLIDEAPEAEPPVRILHGLLIGQGRRDEASALVRTALERQPGSVTLRWIRAGELENSGDIDGAIAIYEALYAEQSNNLVIANNLASLITAHRTDAESLERGYAIARRLRGSEVPAFQDTYGWIEFRRGNRDAALEVLLPAAERLANDPLVQFHAGAALAAAGRTDEAEAKLRRALELSTDPPLPQMQTARDLLARIEAGETAPQLAAPAAPPGGAADSGGG
ncbi:tetratricopeptide repeat protein [Frigidibacter oleivorans]|uniref:tetratricopeptide repeat protein n=1 Tax=Frigidibacter oleivorans TaxID=2487129 RepID=UPI0013E0C61A|nr:tetratricopeptide repeat protein [Frigidibacter oleivorans]